jgi:hypothetical protein
VRSISFLWQLPRILITSILLDKTPNMEGEGMGDSRGCRLFIGERPLRDMPLVKLRVENRVNPATSHGGIAKDGASLTY